MFFLSTRGLAGHQARAHVRVSERVRASRKVDKLRKVETRLGPRDGGGQVDRGKKFSLISFFLRQLGVKLHNKE